MRTNKLLFRAARENRKEFNIFIDEVRANCRDANYDRSYVAPIVYEHFVGLERRSLKEIQRKYQEDINDGHSERYAMINAILRLGLKGIRDCAEEKYERFGHKKLDYELIKFQAQRNRGFTSDPELALRWEAEGDERVKEEFINKAPKFLRPVMKGIVFLLNRKYKMN